MLKCFFLQKLIKSTLQDIVSDELRKIKESSLHEKYEVPTFDTKTDDMIWEEDEISTSYQGDYEEMLLLMERIFYEDLRIEKIKKGINIAIMDGNCSYRDCEGNFQYFPFSHMLRALWLILRKRCLTKKLLKLGSL